MNTIMDLRLTDWILAAVERLTGYGLIWDDGRARWERVR